GCGWHEPAQRLEQGRLAGAVTTQERDDLALAHVERRVMENVALAVEGVHLVETQDAFSSASRRATPDRQRPAGASVDLLHAALAADLFGRASHQHLPPLPHAPPANYAARRAGKSPARGRCGATRAAPDCGRRCS